MKPSAPVKALAMDKPWSIRLAWGWLCATSLPILAFGLWMLADLDDLLRKAIFVPMASHGLVGVIVCFRGWISRRAFLVSAGLWWSSWTIGSLDHWRLSPLELAMSCLVAIVVWTQALAYSRMCDEF